MRRKTESFTGTRPIFTGSPSIVTGGFNLDVTDQNFTVGDIIPAGTLAIRDEEARTVQVIKTAKVIAISNDGKTVSLYVDEFYAPCFAVGDKVLKAGAISGTFAEAPSISAISRVGGNYNITLSKEITNLVVNDVIEEVVKDLEDNAAERGNANSVIINDIEVDEFETSIDVSADTMQYEMYERRVPPIPDSQKDDTGVYLANNPHIKLTKSR